MKTTIANNDPKELLDESQVSGPMMTWNRAKSPEEMQAMSDWARARKIELEKEKARSDN